jgi:hypothetical protein
VLAEDQRILSSCDAAYPPASWVGLDATDSSAATSIFSERMTALESIVRETTVCSGYLNVTIFTASSSASVTLYDGPLRQHAATDNARLRRVSNAVNAVMSTIRKRYRPAAAGSDQGQSDITGQYRLASEWRRQLGSPYTLHMYLLTDGFQTAGTDLAGRAHDQQQAQALAQQVAVPKLPGATVVIAGLGRVAGSPPSSQVVEALVAYYAALCHRTAAAKCISVSDYQAAG